MIVKNSDPIVNERLTVKRQREMISYSRAPADDNQSLDFSYKIEDLEAEKMFLFNAKISVCFESSGDCRYSYNVLENTKLPKQPCDWKSGFAVPGFSIVQWFADKGLPNNTNHLTDLMSSRLLEDLGVAGFMLHPSCDKMSAKYSPVDGQGWKSDCSSNISVPTLPDEVVCHLDSTCTGLSCCVNVGLIDQSISVYLTLDPCDYKLNIGIEKYKFEFSLLDFEFGIHKRFHIAGVMEMDYKITDLPGEAAFYVDLDLKVCLDDPGLPGLLNTKVCMIHTNILSGTKLPKTPCGWQKGFVDSNWSLSTWYNNMGLKPGTQLPTDAVLLLMDTLGVAEFLNDKQCDRHDPFSVYASQYEGWSTDCRSTSVVLPRLQDDYITCYLDNTCRNVQCCMDVFFVSRSFQVQVNFDPCNYLMTFEIEKLQINATLNEYEWGKWTQIDLYGVIKLRFILHDLYAQDQYLLSLTLSLCWESHGSCQDHHIFRNTRLPKPTCDWNMDFKIPGFSLKTFMTSEGLTTLTDPVISQLSEDLRLSTYLNSPTCDRSALPYKPKVNGWNNECKTPVASLEDISSHAACHIPDRCTAIDCCITIPSFKRNVNVFVDLDPCEFRLSIAIEKIHLNLSLVDYKWGSFQQFSLLGVINLNFTIDDLASDDVFVFNMNVSVCLESSGPCELQLHLFKSTKLPKQTCNWNTDYKIQDFSLRSYLTDLGLSSSLKKLESHTTSELLHDLGIAPFLLGDQCDRGNLPYFPNKDGWNKGCPKPVSLNPLPNNTFCHLYEYCTGVTCCSDVALIGRTIKTYVSLDPCNRKMSLGIEKLSVNTSLFDYHFGSIERVKLHGVVHLDYEVVDLESEKKFMVSLNLSICFESHGPCVISIPVLKNARLPKAVCDWKSDFIDPNFSFERFLNEKRLAPNDHLNTNEMKSLMDKLRITEFLQDNQCDTSQSPFSPSVNGWNNDCKLPMAVLPNNTGPATCNIHNTCTAVECCVTADQIGRSFRTFVNFEPCLFKLTVGIEQLTFDRLLFDYEWGQPVQVWLFGFVRFEFTISDLETEGQYLFDMTLKVCFEVEGPCYVTVNVFNKYRLPIPACDWNTDFFIKGFSLNQWMKNESFTASPTLAPYMTSKLLSDLNVAAYMKDEKCKLNGPLFTPNIKGWKSECPTTIAVPDLPDNIVCHISDTCTDVNCCVHIPLLNKTFESYIRLDPCYEQLSVGIEKMHNQYKLLDYSYGKTENFNLLGLLRSEYSMYDLKDEGMYVMNLTFSFCVESSSECNISIPILQNVRLPKKTCTWTEDYKVKDFSLDQWTKERNQKPGAFLPDYYTSELLQQLDITNYLNTPMCTRKNSSNGWIKDCSENVTLPDLTSNPLTCQLHSSCTSVECCMDVPFIGKTFRAVLDLNQDTQILNIGIEKLQLPLSLLDFDFGKDHEFRLNSVIRIRYNIYDLESQNKYLVTMEISLCWEKYKSCDWTAKVFDHTRLPKLIRNIQTGFDIPHFSLTSWSNSHGINTATMNNLDLSKLYRDLDLGWYLTESCNRTQGLYQPQTDGWNSACAEEIHLASLPPNSACHVTNTCTDIECCVDIPILQRSARLQINLEPCDLRLTVQLEGMEYSQMLYNYSWGTQDSFWLRGVFRFSYKIEDLVMANRYRLSLQFDSCFESSQPCSQSVTILDKVELPKVVCVWKQDYQIQEFSVDQWKQKKNFKASTLAEYEVSQLLEETRLGFYLRDGQCIIPTGSSKWENDCSSRISPGVLDGPIHCHISKECTSVDCCVKDEITQRNYNVYLTIDPCDFKLIIGAEKYTFTQSLLDFKWKTQYLFEMEGIIRMSIDIEDLPGRGVYIVSVNSSICWDNNSTCDYSVKIFENIQLPKPKCNFNKGYLTNDFSLTQWYTDTGYKPMTTLTGNQLTDLLEELGIVKYYETSECNRTLLPYQPTEANGWNIACPALEDTLPTLPSEISCSLLSTCTGVDCCVDITLLGRSVHTTVDIDPCYLGMTVGIERMEFNTSLMDYTWGSVIDVALYGVVRFKLTVDDLYEENLYIVNMNISVCYESKGPCAIESAVILKNSLIPKMQCNFTHGFNIGGFSLSKWLTERDLKGTKTIPKYIVSQMMEYLDLSPYLHDTSCNRKVAPWGPNFDGWMKECKTPISVPYLKETETTCIVEDTCTAVRCCVEMSLLDRSFEYSIKLDACSFVLSVEIEKLTHNHSLIGYKFGEKRQFYMNGVLKIDYIIDELQSSNEFLLSVNLSVCLEPTYCVINRTIAENVRMPKPSCDWNRDYNIPGFSLKTWMTERHFVPGSTLPEYAILQLVKDLGVAGYLKGTPCNRSDTDYTPAVQGWKNECPVTTVIPSLQNGMSCRLLSSCTAVDCCLDVDIIGHSINTVLRLDPCDQRLTIGIENLMFNVSLYEFDWATAHKLYMDKVFRIDYAIYDLESDHQYMIELNISLCFESSEPCMFTQAIFSNTKLTKKPCDWQTGFVNPKFSVSEWRKEHGIDLTSALSPIEISKLKETLGIAPYLSDKACQRYNSPYSPPLNGWRTECSTQMTELKALPFNINCYIDQTCTDVQCCMDIGLLSTSMEAEVKIDPCDFMLTVRIEKLTFELTLFDYHWGKQEYFDLYGVMQIEFSVDNLYEEKKYLINMNLTTSFEASGAVESHVVIFENHLLPKQACQWKSDYFIKGFSLYSWLSHRGFKPTDALPKFMLYQLYEETNLAAYFLDDKCDRAVHPYNNTWSQDCSMNLTLPTLKPEVACHISDVCTGLTCCSYNQFLQQTFEVMFQLDPCENKLSIGIEKTMFNRTLTDFKWGEDNYFSMQGIVRVRYNIEDLQTERMYLVNIEVMFCYETNIPQCDSDKKFTVLKNTKLPKQHCDWSSHSIPSGFSLSNWYNEYGLAPGSKLEDWMISYLLNDLSISSYLNTQQCRRSDNTYTPSTNGWNKACIKSVSLPSIPNPTSCHLTYDCTSIECCVDVNFIPRSFGFYLHIDPCSYELIVGIEKFRRNISLTNYKWGQKEDLWLVGVFHLSFAIDDLPGERIYVVSLNMSECFEDGQPCNTTIVLNKSRLPKDLCVMDNSYYIANFSLRNWKASHNGMNPYAPLPDYGKSLLFEKLGISPYLQQEECGKNTAMFNQTVWTDTCPLNTTVSWTSTPDVGIPCQITSLCTGMECCLHADQLDRDFQTRVIVDPCQFVVSVGIDNYIHNISLAKYEFGKLSHFSIAGVVTVSYAIEKISEEHSYMMSMNVSVCTESQESCEQNYVILDNVLLPVLQCDWDTGFSVTNFSLSDWMTDHKIPPASQLSDNMASKLFQYVGLSYYLKSPSCSRSSNPYTPSQKGWNNLCTRNVSLSDLTDPLSCYLDYTCSTVDCCIDVDKVGRTLMASLSIDHCQQKLTIQLERLTKDVSLLNYTWGTQEQLNLLGVLRADFSVHNLESEDSYLVNLDIHICFETTGPCVFSTSVLSNVKLPQTKCDWSAGKDFSLTKWLSEKYLTTPVGSDSLPQWAVLQLREDLGLSRFLSDQQCYNVSSQFMITDNGWNSECVNDVSVPDISGSGVVCSIPTSCTTLECCIDTPILNTSIQTSLSIIDCRNTLHVQIGQRQTSIRLNEVPYGIENTFSMFGIVNLIYQIDKLSLEKAYKLNVNISVCYETGGPCQINVEVFNNTILNQTTCTDEGFLDKAFSLTKWLTDQGLTTSSPATDVTANDLIMDLGLNDYMGPTSRCDLTTPPYSLAVKGWTNDCSNMTKAGLDLTGDIACHIPSTCSSMACCVQSDLLRRSLFTSIDLNTCLYTMTVTIEDHQHEIQLLNYKWGTNEEIQLHGAFRLNIQVMDCKSGSGF